MKNGVDIKPTGEPLLAEKITAVKKVKDPKRVEAGQKLAAISKAAKEKKMREKIEMEKSMEKGNSSVSNYTLTAVIAIGVILVISFTFLSGKKKRSQ